MSRTQDTLRPSSTACPVVCVLVPTFRRPHDLERCLDALSHQTRAADRVIVVCRPDDEPTHALLTHRNFALPLAIIPVYEAGQVAALNAGLAAIDGDILAITDDDAAPRPAWLAQIVDRFAAHPEIAGVGGRDVVAGEPAGPGRERVGIVQWFGRHVGNHHLGVGGARYVDILKGANMSYRVGAIRGLSFDRRLRGSGAQAHNDLAFSLSLRRRGMRLLYDPLVLVDHFPAQRHDDDQRSVKSKNALSNAAFNETLALFEYLPLLSLPAFLIWALLVGNRDLPGFAQFLRRSSKDRATWNTVSPVLSGRIAAVKVGAVSRLRIRRRSRSRTARL